MHTQMYRYKRDVHKRNESRGGHRMSSTAFQLLSPLLMLLLLSSETELWNWIAEHISTNKATLHLAANRGKDQHRDSDNTLMSAPDKFSNCWKENKSADLNQKCIGSSWTDRWGGRYRRTVWLVVLLCSLTLTGTWSFKCSLVVKMKVRLEDWYHSRVSTGNKSTASSCLP